MLQDILSGGKIGSCVQSLEHQTISARKKSKINSLPRVLLDKT